MNSQKHEVFSSKITLNNWFWYFFNLVVDRGQDHLVVLALNFAIKNNRSSNLMEFIEKSLYQQLMIYLWSY